MCNIPDEEMSKVLEALRTAEFPTVDVTMNDTPIVFKLDDASLEAIRAIVQEEVRNYGTEMIRWIARSGA